MKYLAIFIVVWLTLILLGKLLIRFPEKGAFDAYPKLLLLKGVIAPKYLQGKMTESHLLELKRYRRSYLLFCALVLDTFAAIGTWYFDDLKNEQDEFLIRMQEKYPSN